MHYQASQRSPTSVQHIFNEIFIASATAVPWTPKKYKKLKLILNEYFASQQKFGKQPSHTYGANNAGILSLIAMPLSHFNLHALIHKERKHDADVKVCLFSPSFF